MYLEHLSLKNYRLFDSISIDFHNRLTVLVGDNSAGKTTILEGASVALGTMFIKLDNISGNSIKKADARLKSYSLGTTDDVQPQYPVRISAEGIISDKPVKWSRSLNAPEGSTTFGDAKGLLVIAEEMQQRLRQGDVSLKLPLIAYYGTGRLWDNHREKKFDIFKTSTRTNGYIDCLDGTSNLKLMMAWFQKMTIQKYQRHERSMPPDPAFEVVIQALRDCFASLTGYQNVDVSYNLNTNELDIYYSEKENTQMKIALSQLSAGYKGTISLIADMAYRTAILNPQLLGNSLRETEGVVLIDEIDLHLHPSLQKHILTDLLRIFPRIQFIVSSHAPTIINSVHSENLVILKDLTPGLALSQVYGKDVKSVLGEIMGVDERPEQITCLFKRFYQHLSAHEYDAAESTLNQLDELREYHDPEVAGCRVKLKMERIRGGVV